MFEFSTCAVSTPCVLYISLDVQGSEILSYFHDYNTLCISLYLFVVVLVLCLSGVIVIGISASLASHGRRRRPDRLTYVYSFSTCAPPIIRQESPLSGVLLYVKAVV